MAGGVGKRVTFNKNTAEYADITVIESWPYRCVTHGEPLVPDWWRQSNTHQHAHARKVLGNNP